MTDHLIIGLPKCGTSSLFEYLKVKFPKKKISKMESIYDPAGRMVYNTWHSGASCHVVVREQADRLWSGYYYFGYWKRMPFEVFLENEDIGRTNLGFNQPLEMCNWTPFLSPFMDLQPTIHYLHELVQLEDFPHKKNQTTAKPEYPEMPKEYRYIVEESLKDRNLDKYGIPNNWDYLNKSKKTIEDELEFESKYM